MRTAATFTLLCREPLRALGRNKLRAVLAGVAIAIGIASVVCVVAIGEEGSRRAAEQLRNLGDNYIQVEAGSRAPNGVRTGSHGTTSLTGEDAEAILAQVRLVKRVSPNVDGSLQIVFGDKNWFTRYRGVSPDYLDIKHWPLAEGAPFTDDDVLHTASVCLLGATVREKLFGDAPAAGQTVRIGTHLFRVDGVLARKGPGANGQDQDDAILLPWTTVQRKLRGGQKRYVDDIFGSAISPEAVNPAIEQIVTLLRERHRIRPGTEDDFNIRRQDELLKAQLESSQTLEALLVAIASIALVVGGIGVMNVMLVSVTERTREIGLRLAVGATDGAVQLQFLGEAVLLTLLGGLAGIGGGAVACVLLGKALDWTLPVPLRALVWAPFFAVAVGLFFGFYPARTASRLDPITALRHE